LPGFFFGKFSPFGNGEKKGIARGLFGKFARFGGKKLCEVAIFEH
jgi:hypothetical protein